MAHAQYLRLSQIDPDKLAERVTAAVRDHVHRLCFDVGLSAREDGIDNLLHSVRDLTDYAVTGEGLDAPVAEYLISVAPPVWMRAADGAAYRTPEFDDADPSELRPGEWLDELVLVMRAALAREKLDQKLPLAPADLAVLASMAPGVIRGMLQRGEIVGERSEDGWTILPKDARALLKRRDELLKK